MRLEILENFLTLFLKWIAVIFFISGTLLYTFQILSRLFWETSFFWIDSLISYLITLAALIGSALAVRTNENIKIDLLKNFSKKKPIRLTIEFFSALVTLSLILIFYFHTLSLKANGTLSSFKVPDWVLNLPYLILFFASLVYYLRHILDEIKRSPMAPEQNSQL